MNLFNLLLVFIFCFGTCLGSFLNVVIWRLPNKMSLLFPASNCPKCKHPIRAWHNIPILGWLFLGGKCFDCKEPISLRYPVVEFLGGIGCLRITLAFFVVYQEGITWDVLIGIAVCFCVFLTLLAAGLILVDRNRIPFRLFIPAILAGSWYLRNDLMLIWILPVLSILLTFIPERVRQEFSIPVLILAAAWILYPYAFIL